MAKLRLKKYLQAKHLKWSMVKFAADPSPGITIRWCVHEIIHPRFSLYWSVDPTVLRQTGHSFRWYRRGVARGYYRFQIFTLCVEIWVFRDRLWSAED